MTNHIRVSIDYDGVHPIELMKSLGITYQHITPKTILEQYWFWNCENIPNILPEKVNILEVKSPFEMVGYGLSKEDAEKISNYQGQLI